MTGAGGLPRRRPVGYVAHDRQRTVKARSSVNRKHRKGWAAS